MNIQVDPKPYTLREPPIDPFKGTLKGTRITTHEPPSRVEGSGVQAFASFPGSRREGNSRIEEVPRDSNIP